MSDNLTERQQTVNVATPQLPRTAAGDALSALVTQIFKLNGRLLVAGDKLAKPAGQTSARWQVLAVAENNPATVAQIARAIGLTRQSVQRVANVLVAERFATFRANPQDRRADLLSLTKAGQAALQEIQVRQRVWADALGAAIGEDELRRALEILREVDDALSEKPLGFPLQ